MTNQTAMPELFPCPFCGSASVFEIEDDNLNTEVGCEDCGARVGDNDGKGNERWNRRALSKQGEPIGYVNSETIKTFKVFGEGGVLLTAHRDDEQDMAVFAILPQAEAAQAPGKQEALKDVIVDILSNHGWDGRLLDCNYAEAADEIIEAISTTPAQHQDQSRCPACQGNDGNMPCAYPSEGKPGCLRDKRLGQSHPVAGEREIPKIWYMRDNHTFRQLPENVEAALRDITEELDAGFTSGMLCTKREGANPRHLHFTYITPRDEMMEKARVWLTNEIAARAAQETVNG